MVRVSVEVHLKKGVTDPEGDNVTKALRLLGFQGVRRVHASKKFLIDLEEKDAKAARKAVEEMCRRLLANPVIHDYAIALEREPGSRG
ncbi:MAG TPA: phosphoribosylformylglycinamidine synthase subunit PurS [Thermoplasmata archaeon]|jgi:phosphoribosylformylglycinamidine synthase